MLGKKLALLFLTINNPYHVTRWKKFLSGHEPKYSIYVHAKNNVTHPFFKPHKLPFKVPTSWDHTMKAQLALLRVALKNPANKKFVFLSETTIPLQKFEKVYDTLMNDDKSYFLSKPNPHLDKNNPVKYSPQRAIKGIPTRYQQKHWQWIVLNRKHALLLLRNSKYLNPPSFCDNEHFPGTILAYHDRLSEVVPVNTTYVNWSHRTNNGRSPFLFTDLSKPFQRKLIQKALKKNYLFARKFSQNCNLKPLDELLSRRKY